MSLNSNLLTDMKITHKIRKLNKKPIHGQYMDNTWTKTWMLSIVKHGL